MAKAIFNKGTSKETSVEAAEFTAMQEKATAFIFKRTYVNKKRFTSPQDIVKDKDTVKGLRKIFVKGKTDLFNYKLPFTQKIEQNWFETFYKQHRKILQEYPNAKFTIFDRDDKNGFMLWFQNLIKTYFGISNKDTYNPADIWLIDKKEVNRKTITKNLGPKGTAEIEELNFIMRQLYKEKKVMGLSLKLVSGQQAKYEQVNLDEKFFKAIETGKSQYNYKLHDIRFNCAIKGSGKATLNDTQDIVFNMRFNGKPVASFQIKGNATRRFSNLKIEPKAQGAGSVLGKAPVGLVAELTKQRPYITALTSPKVYKFGVEGPFDNNRANFPMSAKQLKDNEKEFKKYFNTLKKRPYGIAVDFAGVTTADQFIDNMMKAFNGPKPFITTHKLMCLKFAHMVLSLKDEAMVHEYMTDLIFLAMKAGRKVFPFGPFGKLS